MRRRSRPNYSRTFQYMGKPQSLPTVADKKIIEIANKNVLTEQDVHLIQRRLNDKKISASFLNKINNGEGYELTPEQIEKGRKYLYNLGFTPKGVERSNSPFGYRENEIVKNLKEIRLKDYYDAGNMYHTFYVPLYEASGNNTTMEYYVAGGKINIVG